MSLRSSRSFVTPSFPLVLVLMLLYSFTAYSNKIEEEDARQLVTSLVHVEEISLAKSTSAYYIFTTGDNSGFVIVSRDRAMRNPILGYSKNSGWFEDDMPPMLLDWLKSLESRDINYAVTQGARSVSNEEYLESRVNIPVLITSHWHQDSPYNDLCPRITDGNIKTAAGCVAIAAAQVAYYWRKDNPQMTSVDTPTYPYGKAPVTESIPAGTEFQWDLMMDSYTLDESDEEKMSVARLVYIIGTSAYLQYGASTGGQIKDIVNPFYRQFNLNAKQANKTKFSQEEWEELLYDNLEKSQPVVYAGSSGSSGHAVVLDGYDAELNLFHFNFGWGGSGDGYYTVDDSTGMGGYSNSQSCVYDIYPLQRNISITIDVADTLYVDRFSDINIVVRNGSTLGINDLYLFACDSLITPDNREEAIWHYEGNIENGNSEYEFMVQYGGSSSNVSNRYLILTDGDLNVLYQKAIFIDNLTDINTPLIREKQSDIYYDIKGERLSGRPTSGIYIQKKKNGAVKIMAK